MSKELPGEWGQRLSPKGIHSFRDLAAAADMPLSTVHRVVGGKTSADAVNRLADAVFGGDRDLVWRLRGSTRRDYGDWELPDGATLLTPDQRDAIRAVVKAMVPAEREDVMGNAEHPAATIEAPTALRPAAGTTNRPTARERQAEEAMRRQMAATSDETHDPGASA